MTEPTGLGMSKVARILMVEDDEDDYILTSDSLEQLDSYQFDIHWVTNPKVAVEKLSQEEFDICLLDFQLGAQSGLDVLRQAIKLGCMTPIIMLTGQDDDNLDKLAQDAGAVDYINKEDISTGRFARAIRYALARNEVASERLERLKAETQNRSKDRFLAHLSHELRTPLTSILGYTELLLQGEKAKESRSELNIILSNGKHLLSLLNDVLDLSKIAADKLELNPSEINLDSFIADVFYLLQINAQDKGLSLVITAPHALPERIRADSTRLRQILINLSYNAIKFTDHGQVAIKLWTEWVEQKELLFFEVADTGIGIPAERLASIFKPFEQVEDIVTRKEGGAGLGLAICTELARRMGGELSVESELGKGSRFRFAIEPGDISDVPRSELHFVKADTNQDNEQYDPLQGRVLVVDDAPDIRQLVQKICDGFGLQVVTAENGLQAVQMCNESLSLDTPFTLVLMDIHMPVLGGRQAIAQIREAGFTAPVIALTAAALKGVKRSLMDIGFSDVLHKPINKKALYQCMSMHLAAQESGEQIDEVEPHILLVEDDVDAAEVSKLLLESLGAKVTLAFTGAECLAVLQSSLPVCKILLDLHLPDTDGLSLAAQIRTISPELEIVVVSGAQIEASQLSALNISRSLLKPLNLSTLQSLID
ncbi:response regulator [Paraglaciecola sp.]|uniref:response regulator n=1 Tax=Paraglaciecola sp. TaxID=1920173 RepID=UPI00273DFAA7|nr:response regulator [Paraglaciecola sp.]MDP5033243.1 response regulator [Paraglaciecola sp.]